ncbi:MAG TPA: LuxR C-terminal-related transcriptional regulator [Puia sp.]|nr:LuxR C-terminal-related transcriptional regulator [Puia sp.]
MKKETDIEDVSRFFRYMQQFQRNLHFFGDTTFFIIDYIRRTHVLMTGPVQSIIGYQPGDFLQGGLEFVVDIFHKDDFQIWSNEIFSSTFDLFKEQPHNEHDSYVFEVNYRMRAKAGNHITILQKGSYLTDPLSNLPTYAFGICLNITPYKSDTRITRVISKYNSNNKSGSYKHISTDCFYPDPEGALLTKREKEMLKWISDGFSSKQIADTCHLSQNTVMNHRKSLLRKTNAKNVAELIKYAVKNGII